MHVTPITNKFRWISGALFLAGNGVANGSRMNGKMQAHGRGEERGTKPQHGRAVGRRALREKRDADAIEECLVHFRGDVLAGDGFIAIDEDRATELRRQADDGVGADFFLGDK